MKKTDSEKIVLFDTNERILTDEQIDRLLTESLIKEADELEAELNQNQKLVGADVSDELFLIIVAKLKEMGVWEEDETAGKAEHTNTAERVEAEAYVNGQEYREYGKMKNAQNNDADKELQNAIKSDKYGETENLREGTSGKSLEELYALLPEEDRRALALGKRIREEKKLRKRKRRKVYKHAGIAAAVLVFVFLGSMTSEANRSKVLKVWNGMMYNMGFRMVTTYMDEEKYIGGAEGEANKALEEIRQTTGMAVLSFDYIPEGMEYQRYEIMDDGSEAVVFYNYQEKIFSVIMIDKDKVSTGYYALDKNAVLKEIIINDQKIEAKIWKTNLQSKEETYVVEIDYNNYKYMINAMISLDELKKIVKFAFIL